MGVVVNMFGNKLLKTWVVGLVAVFVSSWVCADSLESTLSAAGQLTGVAIDPAGLAYTPDSSFVDKDGILNLFSKSNQSIFRWDTFKQEYTDTIPLTGVPDYVAYSSENHTIYLAYVSGLIREINLNDSSFAEIDFASLPSKPRGLSTAGSYVFAEDPSGAWVSHYIFASDGSLIEAVDWNYYSKEYVWSDANQKMYFFRDDTTPNDLLWEEINADGITYSALPSGAIGTKKDSPLHTSSGFTHPIRIAPDGSIVVLGSGKIHDATTLARLTFALTNSVSDIAWIGDDIYTTRTVCGATQVQQWLHPAFDAGVSRSGPGTANRLIALDGEKLLSISIDDNGEPLFRVLNADFEQILPELGELSIELLAAVNEGDGVLHNVARLMVSPVQTTNLVVSLSTDGEAEFSVPEQLIIPVGQTVVDFDLTVFDDDLLDGSRTTTVRATSFRYKTGVTEVVVHDNESATLTLSLPQTTFEGAGSIAGALMIDQAPDADVLVEVVSNNPEKIGSSTVVIPAGQTFVSFSLPVLDDAKIDGVQTATIEARVQNWSSSRASVFVFDNETTGIQLDLPTTVNESDGVLTNAGSVILTGSVAADVHVLLTGSDSSELTLPAFVTVPAGTNSMQFDITVIDETETDGAQQVFVVAESPGYIPASYKVGVEDNDVHHLVVGLATNSPFVWDPVAVDISALTIDGQRVVDYTGSVSLTASGDGGDVPVVSTTVTNFSGGAIAGDVIFGRVANNVTLVVDAGAGLQGTSSVFNVMGSIINITPVAMTNTPVVSGGILTRTMVISNAGNVDLEFEIHGLAGTAGSGSEPDPSLIAHYPFNGNADDESGSGYDGTVNGATLTADRFGNADSAYDFNGSSAYINCGNIIKTVSNFTVSAWVNIDRFTDSAYMGPWSQKDFVSPPSLTGNYVFYTATHSTSGFGTSMYWNDGVFLNSRVGHVLPVNEWHLITQTYDGNEVRQYDNGKLVNTTVVGAHFLSSSWDFLIGKTAGYPGYLRIKYFHGQIDDLRVYVRALSGGDILALYNEVDPNSPPQGSPALDPHLILHYTFENDIGTTIIDDSGNGNDGTVYNENSYTNGVDGQGLRIVGNELQYSKAGGHIMLPELDFNSMDELTISMWIRQEPMYTGAILCIGAFPSDRVVLGATDTTITAVVGDVGNIINEPITIDPDEFMLVSLVCSQGVATLYVNGAVVGNMNATLSVSDSSLASLGRHFFDSSGLDSTRITGTYDDVRIYNRALSEAEISKLYDEDSSVGPEPGNFNLVTNGDFEEGNSGFTSTYTYTPSGTTPAKGIYTVGDDSMTWIRATMPDHTSGVGQMLIANGSATANTVVWQQELQVIAGVTYDFSAWTALLGPFLPTLSFQVNGTFVGSVATENLTWKEFSTQWTAASSGTATLSIIDTLTLPSTLPISDQFAIDDIVFKPVSASVPDVGLVAHYPFNGDAVDESGNGHDGTVNGATLTADRFGNADSAYYFNGSNDRIILASEPDFDFERTDSFSQSLWIKTSDTALNRTLYSKIQKDSPYTGYEVFLRNGQVHVYIIHSHALSEIFVSSTTLVNDAEWHHVAISYDGSSSIGGLKIFVDGIAESLVVKMDALTGSILNNVTPTLGSRSDLHFYNGVMDDVRVYNRALSETEISELYTEGEEEPETVFWLTADTTVGIIPAGSNVTVTVTFDADGLPAGVHSNLVMMILCNDVVSPTNEVSVSMDVLSPGSLADFDTDGIPDLWEQARFGGCGCDPLLDADGDGLNNRGEYIAGMDPADVGSCFRVNPMETAGGDAFVVAWESVTGRVYSIHWKNFMGKKFQPLETGIEYPQNSYTDTVHSVDGCGFYQVDVELAPSAPVQP